MGGKSNSTTIGYRLYMGMHMIVCHGTADQLHDIKFAGKSVGMKTPSTGGRVVLDAEQLFGGEDREGGIKGEIDFEPGSPLTQGRNDYLVSKLDANIPGFLGVTGIVFRKLYLGMSAYLKRPAYVVTRIHKRSNGSPQWYDAKAQIGARTTSTNQDSTTTQIQKFVVENTSDFERAFITASNEGFVNDWRMSTYTEEAPGEGGGSIFGVAPGPFGSLVDGYETSYRAGFLIKKWFTKSSLGRPIDGKLRVDVGYKTDTMVWFNDQPVTLTYGSIYQAHFILDYDSLPETNFIAMLSQTLIDQINPYASISISGTFNEVTNGPETTTVTGNSDMNPAHIIRECLTDKAWGMGYAESDIDDVSFTKAADTLYSESMGISILWDKQTPIEDFIKEVLKHIDASIYVNRTTGKFHLKLIRNDYDINTVPAFNASNVEKIEDYSVVNPGEFVNEVIVNYWDNIKNKQQSVSVQDIALVQMQGGVVSNTMQYHGFSNGDIASRVALRDLKSLSSPLISCTIYAYGIENLYPGDVIKLSWPDYALQSVAMRVMQVGIGNGKGKRIRIKVTQDTFGLPNLLWNPPVSEWVEPSFGIANDKPVAVPYRIAGEAPYYEGVMRLGQKQTDDLLALSPDGGYIFSSGAKPTANVFNASLYSDNGAGYKLRTLVDFAPTCVTSAAMTRTTTVVPVANFAGMAQVEIGTHCQIENELCAVAAVSSNSVTLRRGVLDTVPANHPVNSRIFFWDKYVGSDEIEYTAGEAVSIKLIGGSTSKDADISAFPADKVTLNSRAIRPYPPGNVKVNGEYFPTLVTGENIVITWAERNRKQQTSTNLLDFTSGSVTPETGTTYRIRFYNENNTLYKTVEGITGTSYTYDLANELTDIPADASGTPRINAKIRIELESMRDGYASWQKHDITLKRQGYGFNYGESYGE